MGAAYRTCTPGAEAGPTSVELFGDSGTAASLVAGRYTRAPALDRIDASCAIHTVFTGPFPATVLVGTLDAVGNDTRWGVADPIALAAAVNVSPNRNPDCNPYRNRHWNPSLALTPT
jgi:hypothetical protein